VETTEITCPDCGKVIAPAGTIAERQRCQCAEKDRRQDSGVVASPKTSKTCYVCGKDLTGRKRLKDHLGRYWCKECSDADERAKKRADELRCPDCGRMFPDNKLVYFQTERVCQTCYKERERELERKVAKYGAEKLHKKEEINKLKWMAIIAGVLLVLATIFQYLRH
jgi:hypothetical protein